MDILVLQDRVEKTLDLGESQFREFKSAYQGPATEKKPREISYVADDIAEALVAFANADGGELLIGVEDDKTVTGLPFSDGQISSLLEAPIRKIHRDTPLPAPIAEKINIRGKIILYFSVEKSLSMIHQTSSGRCLIRRDKESVPISFMALHFERIEQLSRGYDRLFEETANVEDLDEELLTKISTNITKMSIEKTLQYWNLAEYGMGRLRLRKAALLLFAKDVDHWHPRCQVRVFRIKGNTLSTGKDFNVQKDEIANGNILKLLVSSWELLRPNLVETKFSSDALFREQIMYPEDAIREALVNAIAHRDYSSEGKAIEVNIYDDKMTIQSPGGLLSTLSIDDLKKQKGSHESRNTHIARVLKEIGVMREMGEGMRRIFRLMSDADLIAPEINSSPDAFSISFIYKSVFSQADQRWLDGYSMFKLSREEMKIVLAGKDEKLLSPRQIYNLLELQDWDHYRQIYEGLNDKGIIHNTLSSTQKTNLATRKNVSNRDIPRLRITPSLKLEENLKELFRILSTQIPPYKFNKNFLQKISDILSQDNCYNPLSVSNLISIGLILEDHTPTSMFYELKRKFPPEVVPQSHISSTLPTIDKEQQTCEIQTNRTPICNRNEDGYDKQNRTIYVGNLSYNTTIDDLRQLFTQIGEVESIYMPRIKKGYAFVLMVNKDDAGKAITSFDKKEFMDRQLFVEKAKPRDK